MPIILLPVMRRIYPNSLSFRMDPFLSPLMLIVILIGFIRFYLTGYQSGSYCVKQDRTMTGSGSSSSSSKHHHHGHHSRSGGKSGSHSSSSLKRNPNPGVYTCSTCNALFTCLEYYQQHRRLHAESNGIKLLTCCHCAYSTDNQFHFNWHIMSHTGEAAHRCNVCDKSHQEQSSNHHHSSSSQHHHQSSTGTDHHSSNNHHSNNNHQYDSIKTEPQDDEEDSPPPCMAMVGKRSVATATTDDLLLIDSSQQSGTISSPMNSMSAIQMSSTSESYTSCSYGTQTGPSSNNSSSSPAGKAKRSYSKKKKANEELILPPADDDFDMPDDDGENGVDFDEDSEETDDDDDDDRDEDYQPESGVDYEDHQISKRDDRHIETLKPALVQQQQQQQHQQQQQAMLHQQVQHQQAQLQPSPQQLQQQQHTTPVAHKSSPILAPSYQTISCVTGYVGTIEPPILIQSQTTPSNPATIGVDPDAKPKGKGKGNRKSRVSDNGTSFAEMRRKFHCNHCGKSFKTKSHLQRHILTHTGEKPYVCTKCGSKFNQSSSLRNHMIAIHTKEYPHFCELCQKGFLMPALLHKHLQTSHQKDRKDIISASSSS